MAHSKNQLYSWTRDQLFRKARSEGAYPGIAAAVTEVEEIQKLGHEEAVFWSATQGFIVIDTSDDTKWNKLHSLQEKAKRMPGI